MDRWVDMVELLHHCVFVESGFLCAVLPASTILLPLRALCRTKRQTGASPTTSFPEEKAYHLSLW
jgi:hypothetical protein